MQAKATRCGRYCRAGAGVFGNVGQHQLLHLYLGKFGKNGCDKFGPRFRDTEKVTVVRRVRVEELCDSLRRIDCERSYPLQRFAVVPECKNRLQFLLIGTGDGGRPLVSKKYFGPFRLLGDLIPSCEQARVFRYSSRNGYSQKLSRGILLNSNFRDRLTTSAPTLDVLYTSIGQLSGISNLN